MPHNIDQPLEDSQHRIEALAKLLSLVQRLPFSDRIFTVGSVAQGSQTPRDLDVLVDDREHNGRRPLSEIELLPLLLLSHFKGEFYGLFDPFRLTDAGLWCRNEYGTAWVFAKRQKSLTRAFLRDRILIHDTVLPASSAPSP